MVRNIRFISGIVRTSRLNCTFLPRQEFTKTLVRLDSNPFEFKPGSSPLEPKVLLAFAEANWFYGELLDERRRNDRRTEENPNTAGTKTCPRLPAAPKGMWREFLDFISKYKVMGLAVAFIIGVYLGAVVLALVKDLIMPIIGLAFPDLEI